MVQVEVVLIVNIYWLSARNSLSLKNSKAEKTGGLFLSGEYEPKFNVSIQLLKICH